MNTTGRSEGINSFFDGFVTSTTNLKEFVVQYDQALKRIVKRKNDEDFESKHKFRLVNDNEFLLKHAAKVYTRNAFNKFKDDMSGVFHYKVEEVGNANGFQSFIVKSKEHEVKKFEVTLDLQTQKANKFRIIDSEGLVHDDGKEESEALRLGHMCQESSKLVCLATPSNEAYKIYIEVMNDLSKKLLKVTSYVPPIDHMDNGWNRIQFRMSTKVTGPNTARISRQYGRSPIHLLGGTLAKVTGPNTARISRQYGRSPVHLLGGTLARVTGPNIARCIALHHLSHIVGWLS
ncbi:hypothetical protein RHSIM_Rhsim08G0137500 [Rhododendron simsii]|uniref:Protein FAR1-RELATED SEQUENCE n=1 Tax=Rhododendron simsii TaxID=118357 RepID=A0A834GML1_RHOSS|nr:hypothetical protein RHSIM_Rhsim08G0137500 [Rhododendron simsii]